MNKFSRVLFVIAAIFSALFGTAGSSYASMAADAAPAAHAVSTLRVQADLSAHAAGVAPSAGGRLRSAASTPFECSSTVTSASATVSYAAGSPGELAQVAWVGGATATCTAPMLAMSYQLSAIDPQSVSHPIAVGSCAGCAALTAANTGYTCLHNRQAGTDCSGAWQISAKVTYQAQPGSTWTSVGANCSVAGPLLTCAASVPAGTAKLFNLPSLPDCSTTAATATTAAPAAGSMQRIAAVTACYNLPPSKIFPYLGDVAIDVNIRPYHFPGGTHVDDTKGLFFSSVTDSDLAHIFEAGMMDQGNWTLNSSNYYEKTFPYSGVGVRSVKFGNSLPSTQVTLVVSKFTDDIITMYPADA
ncbi:hypothetical protein OG206_00175 [Streptomyces sp. NBC_01341]|uniref:hypothetical protein n=1 Tax=Streptomyces sp. NBC_01341 TaxID=2903831 RepID=UPI002E14ECDC|nr:hypothetical protein OG206_00175 [Streptomyces sp. NBC_01341]